MFTPNLIISLGALSNSGGDPVVIPELTFKEIQELHKRFYHPNNVCISFYGDDDPNQRLQLISGYFDKPRNQKSTHRRLS